MGSQKDIKDLEPDTPDEKEKPRRPARKSRATATPRAESELRSRLSACFDRIATALEARGDEQMASIIREDAEVMSAGLVSMTRPFVVLRTPLLAVVAVVEPLLAFGRLLRLVGERLSERRANIAYQRAQAEAEAQQQQQ